MIYLIFIPWLLYLFYPLTHSLQMLQQNTYNKDWAYLKWLRKNINPIFYYLNLSQLILFFIILFGDWQTLALILFTILYFSLFIYQYLKQKKEIIKETLKYTARIKRLITTNVIFYLIIIILFHYQFKFNLCLILISLAYLQYLLILLVNFINKPVENLVMLKFKKQAEKKLKNMSDLKTIGITGSYGKTSSKNILNEILKVKYDTLPTPLNYNTPSGLLITINEHLNANHEVFIAEMGARNKGEIKELCNLVHPTYGILTIIGTAHLETFGSRETIQKTKFELIEALPENGIGVLNYDDPWQINYGLKTKAKIISIGINNANADIQAKAVKASSQGITFNLNIKDDKKNYKFETKLLGAANVYNILAAIALALELDVTIPQLQKVIKTIKPVEHRLELKNLGNFYLIDDAYNNSPAGAKMSLDVLSSMPGKKIIITSGMIELGELETEANQDYGKEIADICDEVILIGDKQTKEIQKGLKHKNYDENHIYIIEDIKLAFALVNQIKTKETYVLLKNDLADIYK